MSRIFRHSIVVACLFAVPAFATEPTPERPAIERCREFCGELYGSSGTELEQCHQGCVESEACSKQCKEKHPDDKPKLHKCVRHCMQHGARVL